MLTALTLLACHLYLALPLKNFCTWCRAARCDEFETFWGLYPTISHKHPYREVTTPWPLLHRWWSHQAACPWQTRAATLELPFGMKQLLPLAVHRPSLERMFCLLALNDSSELSALLLGQSVVAGLQVFAWWRSQGVVKAVEDATDSPTGPGLLGLLKVDALVIPEWKPC